MNRILDTRNIVVIEELSLIEHDGYRRVFRGAGLICDDSPDTYARAARFATDAGPLDGCTVAWIGGGLCVGPTLFAMSKCAQTIYECEPALAEFAPADARFVPGDWRDTISGQFDVIVYDLGEEVPRLMLQKFLAPGGTILPKEDA